jgi:NmrA-like family
MPDRRRRGPRSHRPITGATGRPGSAVVRELARHGDPVRALVRDRAKAAALAGLPTVNRRPTTSSKSPVPASTASPTLWRSPPEARSRWTKPSAGE